jgi:hypothetical protein
MNTAEMLTTISANNALMAENTQKVFEAGKAQGGGGDSYYDTFWDAFQQNGTRNNYTNAFTYGWSDESFSPKYDIVAKNCNGMFQSSHITDLRGRLNELGITLDVSKCTSLLQMFQSTYIKHIPIIDGSNATSLSYTFGSMTKIETIEKLILSNKLTNVGNAFSNAENLTHVIFEGTIAITGLDLHWSTKLDAESYDSLIKCYDKTKALTLTLPPEDTVRSVFDAKYGSGSWDAITAEYSNLTISYM